MIEYDDDAEYYVYAVIGTRVFNWGHCREIETKDGILRFTDELGEQVTLSGSWVCEQTR